MNLSKMTINIRVLSAYQALDLGLAVARAWYGDLWRLWWTSRKLLLALLVGVMFLINYTFYDSDDFWWSFVGWGLLWWAKPLFERQLVIYLSHRLFDDEFRTDDVAKVAMPSVNFMLIKRFGLRRMMFMPVHLLEGQVGKVATQRVQTLSRRQESAIGWHTMVFFGAEVLLYMVSVGVLTMLFSLDMGMGLQVHELPKLLHVSIDVLSYVLVVALMAPFYVASGFTMYLCKRSLLEGWDIEIVFRQLIARYHAKNAKNTDLNNHKGT